MAEPARPTSELALVARAEWFVADFFTVDGDPEAADEIERAFVDDAVLPTLPHEQTEPTSLSHVEWARAFRTEEFDDGLFVVDVAFRTVHLDDDGGYGRGPVRAVRVRLVARDGNVAVADLPMPIVAPDVAGVSGWAVPPGAAGADVEAAATDYAFLFDAEPELLEAAGTEDDWRAVVRIVDVSGIRWPLSVRSDALVSFD
jgi:hypothetical protein